jgi:uncharacterized protein (TIGR00251 family)
MSHGSGAAITSVDGGVRISVHAQPGAKKTEVAGLHGNAIKIRIQAPPLEGRANDELIRFLAEVLDVPRAHVTLYRGDKSRTKVFSIIGVDEASARRSLLA